ncbi:MAG: hypothetical protein AMS18_01350 [Gemmatimonas sp. SG8_17]|jgi:hypothetical protein|nr:MAG: hypothetical protein AMS18_01350 [Gemmatimonas sp. SG8_17]
MRRSPAQAHAEREWAGFVAANQEQIQAAGLPRLATQSVEHWDDLLRHGHFKYHPDPADFTSGSLTDDQYAVLVDLVESYFLAGYEFFAPGGLKPEDQSRLVSRFGS